MALAMTPVFAQSTGSMEVETVVVTGTRMNLTSGLSSTVEVSKQSSTITQAFIESRMPGQTFFQDLNLLPGFNFTSDDAYGSVGGEIRMHGQSGDHISVTVDGLPLNDTGNYAMYPNQMLDPEVLGKVTINQGTTDVDSPTAAVTGGSISAVSLRPFDDFGVKGVIAGGTDAFQRYAVRIDSGKIGPWGTKMFGHFSFTDYDKFKGPGKIRKKQANLGFYQDFGSAGWAFLGVHFNQNRNNSINYNSNYIGKRVDTDWSDATDYSKTCTPVTAAASQNVATNYNQASCYNWYRVKLNPSDTGNIRFASAWHPIAKLTVTLDASLQYVLANGGGAYSQGESAGQSGSTPGRILGTTANPATYNANAYKNYTSTGSAGLLAPYACVANVGCDLNGDGDLLDNVLFYNPSTTNTRRWGVNTSAIYEVADGQTVRVAYTLDWGLHRQTGHYSRIDWTAGPNSPWGALDRPENRIMAADGVTPLRYRDRKSYAILNQFSADYQGDYLDGMLHASVGFRLPFFQRDLNNYCYTVSGSSTPYCTSEKEASYDAATNLVKFASSGSTTYVRPGDTTRRYNKFLPHLGLLAKPFGDEHQFYAAYTQELAAPKTDDLYSSTVTGYTATNAKIYDAFEHTKPETSTTYTLGYRFTSDVLDLATALWNTQVKNRIVSSWNEEQRISTHVNVPGINFSGWDFDANYRPFDDLSFYASATYTGARNTTDLEIADNTFALTAGKQFVDTPKWMFSGRVQYNLLPELKLGVDAKYVGGRYASEDDNIHVPDYFVGNADVTYDLDKFGMENSSLRLNIDNMLDKSYYGRISSTRLCYTGAGSCKSGASVKVGAPRSVTLALTVRY
jgi:iron complex outermembrane receptor protein